MQTGERELGHNVQVGYFSQHRVEMLYVIHTFLESVLVVSLPALEGSHFVDNPASGRVLEKLGFEPLGLIAPRMSCARGMTVPARLMRLRLRETEEVAEEEVMAA